MDKGSVVRMRSGDHGVVIKKLSIDEWIIHSFGHNRELRYNSEVFHETKNLAPEEWAQVAEYKLLT